MGVGKEVERSHSAVAICLLLICEEAEMGVGKEVERSHSAVAILCHLQTWQFWSASCSWRDVTWVGWREGLP